MRHSPPTPLQYDRILLFLGARTGCSFGDARRAGAEIGVQRAMARAGLTDADRYYDRLRHKTNVLDDLIEELTIGETYFFRQAAQFTFIERQVIPELRRGQITPNLIRVWSAGCAAGEEPYSLAILFEEQGLVDGARILGTDISRAALDKARAGVYREWSLRGEGAPRARPYLRPIADGFALDERIRRRVAFEFLNLAVDLYPSLASGACGMNLILCRNVLIYFDRPTIERVARRLFESLVPGGWLLTAASDPPLADFAPFQTIASPDGVVYRREEHAVTSGWKEPLADSPPASPLGDEMPTVTAEAAPRTFPSPAAVADEKAPVLADFPEKPQQLVAETRAALLQGDYQLAERLSQARLENPALCALHVQAAANLDSGRAEQICSKALARHRLSPELYYLHAVLLSELGRDTQAAAAARQVIYLDRSLAVAHFTLGAISLRLGELSEAQRAFRNAYQLAAARPPDEMTPLADGESSGRLAAAAAAQLAQLDAALKTTST